MDLQFHCPKCNELVSADSEFGGDMAQCPECDAQIMVPMDAIGTGMVVGNYKLIKKLGTGGMGDVYLAEQAALHRQVALKVLPPAMTRDSKMAERFLQEMRNQAALSHPNIATAYDAGKDRDIHYLAMEYVEGVDLQRILNKRKQLPEREALRVALEIARGLDYAWYKKKMIHRDIKPGNIIVSKDAEVRILDLGLSRSMTDLVDLSGTSYLVGTPLYMSPEQIDSDVRLDFRTDMYSLGSTLYHMLTGKTPYSGKTVTQILTQRATKNPRPVRELNPDISEGCAAVVDAMMARNRDDRFSDWPAAIASINQALDGHVPLTPGGIAAAQKAQEDSSLIQVPEAKALEPGATLETEVGSELKPAAARASSVSVPAPNPMVKVYLAALGVAALVLIAGILALIKLPPRYIEVEVAVAEEPIVADPAEPAPKVAVLPPLAPVSNEVVRIVPEPSTNLIADDAAAVVSAAEEARIRQMQEDERARDEVQALYDFSVENLLESPEDLDPHIEAFTRVEKEAERLEMAELQITAREEIDRLKRLKRERIESLLARLQEQATVAIDAGKYADAVAVVRGYDGAMAAETLNARKTLAASVQKKADSVRKTRELERRAAEKAYAKLQRTLADSIVSNRTATAVVGIINEAKTEDDLAPIRERVYQLDAVVNSIADLDRNILFTFRTEIGKTVEVTFKNEVRSLVIKSVDDEAGKVMASQLVEGEGGGGTLGFSFGIDDLSTREKLKRVEASYGDQSAFVLGFMALQAEKESAALEYFKQADNDLCKVIIERVEVIALKKTEEARLQAMASLEREAKWAFANVLHSARLPTNIADEKALLAVYEAAEIPEDRQRVITLMASSFREKYGSTDFAKSYGVLLRQMSGAEAFRRVSLTTLKDELTATNPGYNGEGVFETNRLSVVKVDLEEAGVIRDLSALKGLPLSALRLAGSEVRDLGPLKDMPLRSLVLRDTGVKQLKSLAAAPLESLSLEGSAGIRGLNGLSAARLKELNLQGTGVSDLRSLVGQPLEYLLVGEQVGNIAPLASLPLKKLSLAGSKVRNLGALQDLELEFIDLLNTQVEDLAPLKNLPLKVVKLDPRKITSGLVALREIDSLAQFQVSEDAGLISAADFWQLYDDGAFEPKSATDEPADKTVKK